MHKNIKTVAGCFTNVTCNVTATDGREVELTAYIAIGQERRAVPKAGANIFAFPAVEYGQHLYEIRADGKPLIFGHLLVRPSAFPVAGGTVDYTLNTTLDSVDALHVDIELAPGPRGYSAYEVAVLRGFVGTEAEWLENIRQQTATLAEEQVTPLVERAEAAAEDAQGAQVKAEQEAGKAEQNAALLGDAALKGGDNVFTGQNVFNGVSNMLPADFWRYDCCTTVAEVRELADEAETFANWNYPLKNLDISRGGSPFIFSKEVKGKRLYLYCEKEYTSFWGEYVKRWNGDELVVYFPNMTGPAFHGFINDNIKKATIILPKVTGMGQYFFSFTVILDLCLVTGVTKMDVSNFWSYGGGEGSVKVLRLPNNKLETFKWENSASMVTVTNGFPHATLVNIQKAKLDKVSVLRIVNSLKPYDASTMEAVPELTLGIDPALEGDEEINAALLNAQEAVENGGLGWNVAVSGFTITAGTGAATMGLRRLVYVKHWQDAEGGYIDVDGVRWAVRWGNTVLENWQANEELGYEAFPSVAAALDEWGLRELTPEEVMAEVE